MPQGMKQRRRRVTTALWILFAAFCLRVAGQALVELAGVEFLPPAEEWYSGAIPYGPLLAMQILIILLLGKICLDLTRGGGWFATARHGLGTVFLTFGTVYLSVMIIRYGIRMALYPTERWTGGLIPIFFHWVLATALLIIGGYYRAASETPPRVVSRRRRILVWSSFWLLVLAAVSAWVGYQLAPAWLARQLGYCPPQHAVRVHPSAEMLSPDSVRLVADVFRPHRAGAKTPTILVRIPYTSTFQNRLMTRVVGRMWAERGYTVVIQATRGRGRSGGRYEPLLHEREDGLATLEWLSRQPWYDGRVGMWGGSYFGYTQWVLADRVDPGPSALCIQEASTNFYRMFYPGGAFALESALYWACRSYGDRDHTVTEEQLERGSGGLPLIEADERAVRDVDFFNDWASHTERDEFWKSIDGEGRAARLQAPLLLMAGWYDPFLPTMLEDYAAIQAEARPEVAEASRLVIAPWTHADSLTFQGRPLTENFRYASLKPSIPWFDRHLRGLPVNPLSPAKIFVMGINRWRSENEWPLARTQYTPFYLHSAGHANSVRGDGILSREPPGESEPPDRYAYDPLDPVPTAGGAMLGMRAGIKLQNAIEERPDVLVYSTTPLSQNLEVTGPVKLVLYITTDAPNTDFTGKLVDVHRDGSAYNISTGIIRRSFSIQERELGRPVEVEISLWPTSMVFLKDHRIRLEVSSSNYPHFDRNPNMGTYIPTERRTRNANQVVFHSEAYPSRMILPIVP